MYNLSQYNRIIKFKNDEENRYGAIELKKQIRHNTFRGFGVTIGLIIILSLVSLINIKNKQTSIRKPIISQTGIELINYNDLFKQKINQPTALSSNTPTIYGTTKIAGNPIPINDVDVIIDDIFASIKEIGKALVSLGNTDIKDVDLDKIGNKINVGSDIEDRDINTNIDNAFDEFSVQKLPTFDITELQGNIVYPYLAKKIEAQGIVIVKTLIDEFGKVAKTEVFHSANSLLDRAAISAINNTTFTPAIQGNSPVKCWIMIPINFKIR